MADNLGVYLGIVLILVGLNFLSSTSDQNDGGSVKKENSCGDGVCSKEESYNICSRDCGSSLLQECIKACITNSEYEKDTPAYNAWKRQCDESCYNIEVQFESMISGVLDEQSRKVLEEGKKQQFKTFIDNYKK